MATRVGARGQVTIEKSIRDALGVGKGWTVLQRLVDGHVELRFVPPPRADRGHDRSLFGSLSKYAASGPKTEDEFHEATDRAWAEAVAEKWGRDSEIVSIIIPATSRGGMQKDG